MHIHFIAKRFQVYIAFITILICYSRFAEKTKIYVLSIMYNEKQHRYIENPFIIIYYGMWELDLHYEYEKQNIRT